MARGATPISLLFVALIKDARLDLAPATLLAREVGDSYLSPLRRRLDVKRRAKLHDRDL